MTSSPSCISGLGPNPRLSSKISPRSSAMILSASGGLSRHCCYQSAGTPIWPLKVSTMLPLNVRMDLIVSGTKRDIPRLWAYFLLDQILPVSFTLNLFCLALLLTPPPKTEKKLYATTPLLQILTLLAYFYCLSQASALLDTPWFLPNLLAIRALLFAPYLVLAPSPELSWRTSLGQSAARATLHEAYQPAWRMVLVCTAVMYVRQYKVVLEDNH